MIPELGLFALILALLTALAQSLAAWPRYAMLARPAALLQFGLIAASFIALTICYLITDLSLRNIVENSHSLKPLAYRFAGVWGNHEGSLLLWILMLSGFGALVALRDRDDPAFTARVLGIQGMIGSGFLLFALFASNPFARVALPPIDGQGLNPVLQDPALVLHPPLLYAGYVGFSVAFSYACAALLQDRFDRAIARRMRFWIMLAWTTLSAGIGLGSWWAYYELGWGGWWFWDPVENASLMPWLLGTALLHSVIVAEMRDALKRWTLLLSILTFSLSLLGTFLVRSGVLTSVHSFAVDPARGLVILALLTLATGGALTLYGLRAARIAGSPLLSPVSREGLLVLNNLFLSTATATVLIGTLYPLVLQALDAGQISVGPPYFHATFVPLCVPLLLLMGVGPLMPWKRGDFRGVAQRLIGAAALSLLVAALVLGAQPRAMAVASIGMALAAWLVAATLTDFARRIGLFSQTAETVSARLRGLPLSGWGMTFAHAGLGVAIAGMIGSSLWVRENVRLLRNGDGMAVGSWQLTLDSVEPAFGVNYSSARATLTARRMDGRGKVTLHPEKRHYPVAGQNTTEAAIHQTMFGDLYVALGDRQDGGWVVRGWTHPLVPFLWIGYAMIALGGVLCLLAHRKIRRVA